MQKNVSKLLGLKEENGLAISYRGYAELGVVVLWQCIPGKGISIVKGPEDFILQGHIAVKPGLLEMNILGECYRILFKHHASQLFHFPPVLLSVSEKKMQTC